MAITRREADQIRKIAHDAGIDDATLEGWTSEAGAYRYALTSPNATPPKANVATTIRALIAQHIADREHAVVAAAAQAAGVTAPPAPGTPLATDRQVEYILGLLDQRRRVDECGGFFPGPTDRAGIAALSREDASNYITSLKGDY